ncbi:dihydroneopterin aldolase [soil metagenome]
MNALLHPRLAECRRIFLRDYAIDIMIGWHGYEREARQQVLMNVDLFVPLAGTTPSRDHLTEVLDYDFIRSTIASRIERGHINLQETLVDDVAALLIAHPGVTAARVSSEKPTVYPDCRSVGIEVFRFRS